MNNVRPDLKTAEAALRSYMSPKSMFRIREPKNSDEPEPKLPLAMMKANMDRELRALDRRWKRFYKAGGKKL